LASALKSPKAQILQVFSRFPAERFSGGRTLLGNRCFAARCAKTVTRDFNDFQMT
jgi:hypothetical protein